MAERSYGSPEGVPIATVLQQIIDDLGLPVMAEFRPDPEFLIHPYVVPGDAWEAVDDLLRVVGYTGTLEGDVLVCTPWPGRP